MGNCLDSCLKSKDDYAYQSQGKHRVDSQERNSDEKTKQYNQRIVSSRKNAKNLDQNKVSQTAILKNSSLTSRSQSKSNQTQIQSMQKMIDNFEKQLQKLKQQSKNLSSPDHFRKNKDRLQNQFIKNIQTVQLPKILKTKRKKLIIGQISAGKSSLLNYFLGMNNSQNKLKVGRGQTTLQMRKVYETERMQVYDSPGINPDFNVFKYETLKRIMQFDQFYICYSDSLKNANLTIRVLEAIRKRMGQFIYLVRTKCDSFTDEDQSTLQQQLQVDKQYIQKMINTNQISSSYKIYAISSKRQMQFEDNKQFEKTLRAN